MARAGAGATAPGYVVLATLITGTLLSAAAIALYSRSEWPWLVLGFIGLVPWLAAIDRVKSVAGALGAGATMSVAYVAMVFPWLPAVLADYSGQAASLSTALVLLAAPLIAPQFMALSLFRQLAGPRQLCNWLPAGGIAGAFAYTATDWLAPKVCADTLAHPMFGSVLFRQGADLVGVFGLTFLLLLVNESVLAILRGWRAGPAGPRFRHAPALGLVLLVGLPPAYGVMRLHQLSEQAAGVAPVRAALVQAGMVGYDRAAETLGPYLAIRAILDNHIALSREALAAGGIDLVAWPETVYPLAFGSPESPEAEAFDRRLREYVFRTGVPLVFGASDTDGGRRYNAAHFLVPSAGEAEQVGRYRKLRLFPFSEAVPALLDRPWLRRRATWMGDWSRGDGPEVIPLPLPDGRAVRIAPLICYDALETGPARVAVRDGAELILTLSNDAWFEHGLAPRLIFIISAFRSIETRRPQFRVTTTGISALITPTGEVRALMGQGERGVLIGELTPGTGSTVLLKLGNWFGPFSVLGAVLVLVAARRIQARNRRAMSNGTPP